MKRLIIIFALLALSITALAQNGKQLYSKYSDLPGMEAVYISPAMFRIIGKIPDVELNDKDINFSSIIKSMTGFYILNAKDTETGAKLFADVKHFIDAGKYELLMEAKEDGEVVRMYTVGDWPGTRTKSPSSPLTGTWTGRKWRISLPRPPPSNWP